MFKAIIIFKFKRKTWVSVNSRVFLGKFMKLNLLRRKTHKSKRDFPFTFCPPFSRASNKSVFCHQLDRGAFFFSY